jgi:hypothetical protein
MRVLTAPDRQPYRGARPGRATTLLGHIVYCGWCGGRLAGKTTPDSLAVIEAGLTAKIREEQRRANKRRLPPSCGICGPGGDVRTRWLAAPLGARRDVIKALVTVTLDGVTGRGPKLTSRVEIVAVTVSDSQPARTGPVVTRPGRCRQRGCGAQPSYVA